MLHPWKQGRLTTSQPGGEDFCNIFFKSDLWERGCGWGAIAAGTIKIRNETNWDEAGVYQFIIYVLFSGTGGAAEQEYAKFCIWHIH